MATPKCKPTPEAPVLDPQSDFQLPNAFTNLVSKDSSQQLLPVGWEIMRRYASFLEQPVPKKEKDYNSILGDA